MRRRKKQARVIKITIFIFVLFSTFATSYSFFNNRLGISGRISGSIPASGFRYSSDSDVRLSISTPTLNRWYADPNYMYQYSFDITNNGQTKLVGFELEIKFNSNITSIDVWNYDGIFSEKTIKITDLTNGLTPGQTINMSFIVGSPASLLTISSVKLKGIDPGNDNEITPEQLPIEFAVTNGWGNYTYQYNVIVNNKTGKKINGWSFEIDLPSGTSQNGGWNAEFVKLGQKLTISNVAHNGVIENNGSVSFGLQISTPIANYIPEISKRSTR